MRLPARTLIVLSALTLLLVPGAVASAGSISSGPLTLTLQDAPFFVKGTQTTVEDWCDLYVDSIVRQGMSASSPTGIASWDVGQYELGWGGAQLTHYPRSRPPKIQHTVDSYGNDCGGGSTGWWHTVVRVTDTKGNVAQLAERMRFYYSRSDNSSGGRVVPGSFKFGTGWAPLACAPCDNGSSMSTTKAGESAVFTLDKTWTDQGATAGHLGLVMTKGPGRGKVKLYFDGALKATIDTYSAAWKYRTYVYDFGPFKPGVHTVKMVNVGTAGRPRVDIQGMGLAAGLNYAPECDAAGLCY